MWRGGERNRELHLEVHLCYHKIVNISRTRTNECEKRTGFTIFRLMLAFNIKLDLRTLHPLLEIPSVC